MIDLSEADFLFKYLSAKPESFGLNWLSKSEIFFKRADLFEDQNDCAVPVKFANSTRAKRREYLKSLIPKHAPDWSHNRIKEQIRKREADIPKTIEGKIEYDRKFGRMLTRKFRICSLSRGNASEFAWNKYADNHKGFMIQYDAHALMNYIASLQIEVFPYPVEYREVIEPFDLDELVNDDTYLKMMIFKLRGEWEHEQEVRIICYGALPKGSQGMTCISEFSNGFTLTIPDSVIAGLFLGKDSNSQQPFIEILRTRTNKIPLYQVIGIEDQLQLQVNPIEY
ncbi:MAG TPA: DUF2971 domain-containing protein [Candidatus Kapabacteria bacterium]|jgi:hypothetical protein|nr:DUF2971 domain-containing protein [Candidatus Kapabacteria bacterium]